MTASQGFKGALAKTVVVGGAGGGQILVYSGTPANGNLILSISPVAGTDSFENSFPAGMALVEGTFSTDIGKISWDIANIDSVAAYVNAFHALGHAQLDLVSPINPGTNPGKISLDDLGLIYLGGKGIASGFAHFEEGSINSQIASGTNAISGIQNFANAFLSTPTVQLTVKCGSNFDLRPVLQPQAGVLDLSSFSWRVTTPLLANAGANEAFTLNWQVFGS